jgi:hypothetical protein
MQLADGGWAVSGDRGDVGVTAMVIQSLTPYYTCESEATDAIDKALRFLSENQLPDGTFSSYGNANAESTAQVLTALSGLGIDCKTDTEFIKENDIIEAMKLFRLYDGSFSHLKDSQTNDSATAEALYSFAAYQRMLEGRSSLYIFEDEEMHKTETLPDEKKSGGYKLPVCIAVASTGVIVCAVLFIMKKRNYKNFAVVLILTISGIVFVWTTDFYSGEDYYGKETVKKKIIGEVTLSITCDSLSDKAKKDFIPEDCIILSDASYKLGDGDTVSDILTEACRVNGIQLDKTDGYVSGINYLYEFDYGELSGWIYAVNGKKASVGSDEYVLGDGDSIEWYYTCEMGNDMEMSE